MARLIVAPMPLNLPGVTGAERSQRAGQTTRRPAEGGYKADVETIADDRKTSLGETIDFARLH